ncbi:MAG: SDR family oxidoreductase [Actinobacteria bacterium]|nr:SDR family oxidoreductase [Actinomycetota bacterium]
MDLGLTDRVYLITTGASGLGLAAGRYLLAAGAKVIIACQNDEELVPVLAHFGGTANAVGLAADLRDPATPERLTAAAVARFGRLDGCLLATGTPASGPVTTMGQNQWRDAFDSVVLGPIRVANATASTMDPKLGSKTGTGGSIVFVLAQSARSVVPGEAVANTLYRGLTSAVKDLSDSFGARGIRVNGIVPGRMSIQDASVVPSPGRKGSAERVRIKNEAEIPLGRYGEAEEFASVAAFLLSPLSSYVTGTLITVDGGLGRAN